MAQITIQTAEKFKAEAAAEKTSRLFYIDHLRASLMILVVLHHVALVYGASLEGYYYVEPPFTSPLAFISLLVFALFNQAWFMGAFFLLAGYFTPGSFDRKGVGSFIKDRLIRLGIPLLVFYFVLGPISFLGFYLMPSSLTGLTAPPSWEAYPYFLGMGPLWFVALLLIFDFGYAGWRMLTNNRAASSKRQSSAPGYLGLAIFVLALALTSYLLRMVIPLGKTIYQFPSLAYLPQYLSFFVIGIIAFRRNWFRTLPGSKGTVGFVLAAVATVLLFPLAFSGQLFSLELTDTLNNAFGNGHWQSAVYALWDSVFAVGISVGLIAFFRSFYSRRSGLGRFLSQQGYAVYIIHIPIIVFVSYALRNIDLEPLLKFGLASVIIVPICFVVAYLVRKLPLAGRVL